MLFQRLLIVALSCLTVVFGGCAQHPLPRMDSYLGDAGQGARDSSGAGRLDQAAGPINVGLLLINDTGAEGSAPALSDRAKAFLTHQVRERVEAAIPIRVAQVLEASGLPWPQDQHTLARIAREQGLTHLLVTLISSAESEVPAYLPLTGAPEQGGQRPNVPGYEAVNYALAEMAVIETAGEKVVARSDGRAWTRLHRLNVTMKTNSYPVIHRSLRIAPIYPPEGEAKDMLRSLAGDEALEQAVARLQAVWPKS